MPAILPTSKVYLCRGLKNDPYYRHTIYFSSPQAQQDYFMSKTIGPLQQFSCTYVRQSGRIRVEVPYQYAASCNYLLFRNDGFENKWFYAFILSMEYVNNSCVEFEFKIDEIQSWFFEFQWGECFVERNHSSTDQIGYNIVPDDLYLGDYVQNAPYDTFFAPLMEMKIIAATTFNSNFEDTGGGALRDGVYNGLTIWSFPTTNAGVSDLNQMISQAVSLGKESGIINIYQCPAVFADGATGNFVHHRDFTIDHEHGTLNGYRPRNNKMYTYPYNFLQIGDKNGQAAALKYEEFSNLSSPSFRVIGNSTPSPSMMCIPKNYRGYDYAVDESVSVAGFPTCSWNSDAYQAWLAQVNAGLEYQIQAKVETNAWSGIKNFGSNLLSGNIGGAIAGAIGAVGDTGVELHTDVLNRMAEGEKSAILPPQAHGSHSSTLFAGFPEAWRMSFKVTDVCIKASVARRIDKFWDMYGYPMKQIYVPNISLRPSWNYAKTAEANVGGNAPQSALIAMRNAFNNGVTFWKNGDNIGNYSLDNSAPN